MASSALCASRRCICCVLPAPGSPTRVMRLVVRVSLRTWRRERSATTPRFEPAPSTPSRCLTRARPRYCNDQSIRRDNKYCMRLDAREIRWNRSISSARTGTSLLLPSRRSSSRSSSRPHASIPASPETPNTCGRSGTLSTTAGAMATSDPATSGRSRISPVQVMVACTGIRLSRVRPFVVATMMVARAEFASRSHTPGCERWKSVPLSMMTRMSAGTSWLDAADTVVWPRLSSAARSSSPASAPSVQMAKEKCGVVNDGTPGVWCRIGDVAGPGALRDQVSHRLYLTEIGRAKGRQSSHDRSGAR